VNAILIIIGLACVILAVSGAIRMARTSGGARDAGSWHAPLIFCSLAIALLTAAGGLPLATGALLALLPLLVVAAIVRRAWLAIARAQGRGPATRRVLSGLGRRLRDAVSFFRDDLRDLASLARPKPVEPPRAAPGGGTPAPALAALRSVPSARDDGALGFAPLPAEVAMSLEEAGVEVPPPWRAVAEWAADFEPDDQDDLEEHMAQEAAGILSWAEAAMTRAETLLGVRKLHPAYVAALLEVADDITELASSAAMASRRYHGVYEGIEDWHEEDGNELPEDARGWFGDGGAA
jgi:hypothetical protein